MHRISTAIGNAIFFLFSTNQSARRSEGNKLLFAISNQRHMASIRIWILERTSFELSIEVFYRCSWRRSCSVFKGIYIQHSIYTNKIWIRSRSTVYSICHWNSCPDCSWSWSCFNKNICRFVLFFKLIILILEFDSARISLHDFPRRRDTALLFSQ